MYVRSFRSLRFSVSYLLMPTPIYKYIFFSSRFTTYNKQRIIQSEKNSGTSGPSLIFSDSEKIRHYHTPFSKKTEDPGEGSPSTDNFKPIRERRCAPRGCKIRVAFPSLTSWWRVSYQDGLLSFSLQTHCLLAGHLTQNYYRTSN